MKVFGLVLFAVTLFACSSKSEQGMIDNIQETENKLREMSSSPNLNHVKYKRAEEAYIRELIDLYKAYPSSERAPECIDKVHMVYSGKGNFELASKWADTILLNYPKYPNRALVLESQASTYDAILEPRDSSKVRKYYSQLLEEFPDLDKEKREGIEKRLQYNSLTFDEYIIIQMVGESIEK